MYILAGFLLLLNKNTLCPLVGMSTFGRHLCHHSLMFTDTQTLNYHIKQSLTKHPWLKAILHCIALRCSSLGDPISFLSLALRWWRFEYQVSRAQAVSNDSHIQAKHPHTLTGAQLWTLCFARDRLSDLYCAEKIQYGQYERTLTGRGGHQQWLSFRGNFLHENDVDHQDNRIKSAIYL